MIRIGVPALVLFLVVFSTPLLALETAERMLNVSVPLGPDGAARIENLLGSVRLSTDPDAEEVTVEARAVAEADTAERARELVDAIRLQVDASRVHVVYPLDEASSFRPPKAGMKGLLSRWSAPVLRRKTTMLEYEGRRVEVSAGRKSTGLAVHLEVRVPFDAGLSLAQAAGTIHGRAIRGDLRLETVSGDVIVEKLFGTLDVVTGNGDVSVTSFQGETFAVRTDSGSVKLLDVRAGEARLRTGSGAIRGARLEAASLSLESVSGNVDLRGVEPESVAARTDSGEIDLSSRLSKLREAEIRSKSGDVTLRVGELSHFDLMAETRSGGVKAIGLDLVAVEGAGKASTWRHGAGGTDLHVIAASVVVRPFEGSRLEMFLRDSLD